MRLASFRAAGADRFGIVIAAGLIELSGKTRARTLKEFLANGHEPSRDLASLTPTWGLDEVEWLPPIPNPSHIIGIGLNTRSHFEETSALMKRTPGDYPAKPRLFMRSPFSHVGHRAALRVPKVSTQLDYEGEIAVIIGRAGRYIPAEQALEHVAGYACYNDGSVRDFQMHSNQVTAGKNFAASGAFGPWLVTSADVPDPSTLTLQTRVNGELRQHLVMDDLIFDFATLIAYISQILPLQAGDVILTGSPAGIGAVSGQWLKPGDVVEVEIPQAGVLVNPVAAEL